MSITFPPDMLPPAGLDEEADVIVCDLPLPYLKEVVRLRPYSQALHANGEPKEMPENKEYVGIGDAPFKPVRRSS